MALGPNRRHALVARVELLPKGSEAEAGIVVRHFDATHPDQVAEVRCTAPGELAPLSTLKFSSARRLVGAAFGDGSLLVCDTAKPGQAHLLEGHHAAILSVAFNADDTLLATGDRAGEVRLWHLPDGKETAHFKVQGTPVVLALAPAEPRILVVTGEGPLADRCPTPGKPSDCWTVTSLQARVVGFDGQSSSTPQLIPASSVARSASWGAQGPRLIVADNTVIRVVDPSNGSLIQQTPARIGAAALAPNGDTLFTSAPPALWDLTGSGRLVAHWPLQSRHPVRRTAFSPDSTRIAVGSHGWTDIWSLSTGTTERTLYYDFRLKSDSEHPYANRSTSSWSADGRLLLDLDAEEEPHLRAWDTQTGIRQPALLAAGYGRGNSQRHSNGAFALRATTLGATQPSILAWVPDYQSTSAFSSDASLAAVAERNGLAVALRPTGSSRPDERSLGRGSRWRWEAASGRKLPTVPAEIEEVRSDDRGRLSFAKDAQILAWSLVDQQVVVVNTRTGALVATTHSSFAPDAVRISPDGTALAWLSSGKAGPHYALWRVSEPSPTEATLDEDITAIPSFDPKSQLLALGLVDGVELVRVRDGHSVRLRRGGARGHEFGLVQRADGCLDGSAPALAAARFRRGPELLQALAAGIEVAPQWQFPGLLRAFRAASPPSASSILREDGHCH